MPSRFQWYASRERALAYTVPAQAFRLAAAESAGVSARAVQSKATGALARDVSRPYFSGPLSGWYGSSKPYAAMENFGGVIRPRRADRLLIRGNRAGALGQLTRSSVGGDITASAEQVQHRGKHFLEVGMAVFTRQFILHLRRLMPGGGL